MRVAVAPGQGRRGACRGSCAPPPPSPTCRPRGTTPRSRRASPGHSRMSERSRFCAECRPPKRKPRAKPGPDGRHRQGRADPCEERRRRAHQGAGRRVGLAQHVARDRGQAGGVLWAVGRRACFIVKVTKEVRRQGARYRHAHFRRRSGRRRAIGYFTGSSSSPSRPGRGARSNSPARTTARRCSRLWPCGGTRCGSRPSIWRGGRPVARLLGGAASAAAAAAAPQVNVFALSARTRNTTFCTFVACSTHLWGRDRTPLPEWPRSERGADALRPAARAPPGGGRPFVRGGTSISYQ